MDKTIKTLIIIVIILVAVLGVAGGFILQGFLSDNENSTNENPINTTQNESSNSRNISDKQTNKTTSSNSDILSAQQAINIYNKNDPNSKDYIYKATFIQNGDDPYYRVNIYYKKGGKAAGYIDLDAKTGETLC